MGKNEIDKPKQQAVALSYQQKNNTAPKVIAKGSGFIAEKIIAACFIIIPSVSTQSSQGEYNQINAINANFSWHLQAIQRPH